VQNRDQQDRNSLLAGRWSDLRFPALDVVEDRLKGRVAETALFPSLYIVLKSGTEPFRSKIESLPEWLMKTIKFIIPGHENLACCQMVQGIFEAFQNDSPSRTLWNRHEGA
jgi:hypothetical protein